MQFKFIPLSIPDVVLVEPPLFGDNRGFFMETYQKKVFAAGGIVKEFVQDNHSRSSARGTLRGLHFQKEPVAQGKLVRVVSGSVLDVAVDIRKGSPTFGKWVGMELSSDNHLMLYVPEGFAHGFCTLEDDTEVVYKCTAPYSPEHDAGILWKDREIGITWPVPDPVVSEKDGRLPLLKDIEPYG
ncbi:MAG: dTDP-4-dehydrorhamnose 3,5-epimerase [Candidatus Omnitrophica bacterium]|nr:dTDP-4-dehydrorhamnose 3,5-epimerase [Candidatus Omnitrophota bacterium]MDD5488839.1 dTDP-4-dehydrorhamnose 3,5-epimerase [Candidatus Omnitrophota bacterium]